MREYLCAHAYSDENAYEPPLRLWAVQDWKLG